MLLQLAIDSPDHVGVVADVADLVDIVEVGTPLLKRMGLGAVVTLHERAPRCAVLVDSKTVDGGGQEARMYFEAGATFMTVLANASAATFAAVNAVAADYGGFVVADTLCCPDFVDDAHELPDRFAYVVLHSATDERLAGKGGRHHIESIAPARARGYHVAIAGGISESTIDEVVDADADVVIVGRAITHSSNPRGTAEWISSRLKDRGHGWPHGLKSSFSEI